MDLLRWPGLFINHPDPLTRTSNLVALVVAWNTPFFPLYLLAITGWGGWPTVWLTLCSFPFFLLVPIVARRSALAGRVMLPVTGALNTAFCTWVLGQDAGIELFYLPCILLAAVMFRRHERWAMVPTLSLPFALYLLLDAHLGPPLLAASAEAHRSLIGLSAFSIATLTAFIGLTVSGLLGQPPPDA